MQGHGKQECSGKDERRGREGTEWVEEYVDCVGNNSNEQRIKDIKYINLRNVIMYL